MVPAPTGLLQQTGLWEMIGHLTPLTSAVILILLVFSIYSWTIIFAKWSTFGRARRADARFLRAFRKASGLDSVMVVSEQFRPSPMVAVFDFGYEEVSRQVKAKGSVANQDAINRSLQIGTNQQIARLENGL